MKESERENLKSELLHLKKCQLQYFTFSITGAGLITGLGQQIGNDKSFIFFAPLLVVLPCWWIFFDKGSTITRIVGYLRILEAMIIVKREAPYKYWGWENSLQVFRDKEKKERGKVKLNEYMVEFARDMWKGFYQGLLFRSTQKYWSLCWYTFLILSTTSLWLSFPKDGASKSGLWYSFFGISIFSFIYNLRVLGRLIGGSYSYKENHERWKKVLQSPDAGDYLDDMFSAI